MIEQTAESNSRKVKIEKDAEILAKSLNIHFLPTKKGAKLRALTKMEKKKSDKELFDDSIAYLEKKQLEVWGSTDQKTRIANATFGSFHLEFCDVLKQLKNSKDASRPRLPSSARLSTIPSSAVGSSSWKMKNI